MLSDRTIAAVSTPVAPGGLGVIRISGPDAIDIASAVFRPAGGRSVSDMAGYTAAFGMVFDNGTPVDEAVLLVFRAPHSYTGENVAEISCHGGVYVVNRVLRAVLAAGAEPAGPGEFTRRAFMNGKMDLTEAEAVMSLISAQGEESAAAALTALEGALSKKIKDAARVLIADSAQLAAWVDYPDDETDELSEEALRADCLGVIGTLESLLAGFDSGRALTGGVDTCIAGKPNVGKSTVMNLLSGTRRSIVTEREGTTRDVVEETVNLGGVTLRLADTAGLRESDDEVEKIGVDMALDRIDRASLVLAVFDGSRPADSRDDAVISRCEGKKAVAIVNKNDLPLAFDMSRLAPFKAVVSVSAAGGEGLEDISRAVVDVLDLREVDTSAAMLANERQRSCCLRALECLKEAVGALDLGLTLDAVNVSVDAAVGQLLALTGEKASDAVIDEIFSRFCVGK